MSGVVTFDPTRFKAAYPAFAAVGDGVLTGFFTLSTVYLDNTACSPVQNLDIREQLLWLLVAHIAQLSGVLTPEGQGSSAQIVGRMSQATEGSVTVQTQMPGASAASSWYLQTQYGAMYWTASAPFRTFRYRLAPQPVDAPAPQLRRYYGGR